MPTTVLQQPVLRRIFVIILLCLAVQCTWKLRMVKLRSVEDFNVYSTASELVREGKGKLIYEGADTGADPQLVFARPDGAFQHAASARGMGPIRMYVYPPLLADLFVPLTYLSARGAAVFWLVWNVGALLLSGFLMLQILRVPWNSVAGIAMLVGIFGLSATAQTIVWGQITVLLLLLWVAGFSAFQQNLMAASALAFALGTSLKLTPVIVVVPMLLWRQWRWLSWFAVWMTAIMGAMLLINGPDTVADFYRHVAPAMSAGVPHMQNHTLLALVQRLYLTFHGDMLLDGPPFVHSAVPSGVSLLGKALSAMVILAALIAVLRRGQSLNMQGKLRVLAAFAALSLLASPVSWVHAYVLLLPALAFLWRDAFAGLLSRGKVILLAVCWVETSAIISHAIANQLHSAPLRGLLSAAVPAATFGLSALTLWDALQPVWRQALPNPEVIEVPSYAEAERLYSAAA